MNADQQDFEALRRLLKLKRHEQPPPRYFNDFSARVVQRIQAGRPADREKVMERLAWESPWLQKVLSVFQGKPMVTGALATAVCAMFVGWAIYSELPDAGSNPLGFGDALPQVGMAQAAPLFEYNSVTAVNSTNPVMSPSGASIFDGIRIKAQPAGFHPGGD